MVFYFYGYLLGDGCISGRGLIKICDGHPNPSKLNYSKTFMRSLQDYVKRKFNLPSQLSKIGNKYELVFTNRFLCDFFKFFYGFSKHKGSITKPVILNNKARESCTFYRAYFDADAGIKDADKFLSLKCNDSRFLENCRCDLESYGVRTSTIKLDKNSIGCISVYSHNLYDYAKHIGFYHPRKKEILIKHLKKGCKLKRLVSKNLKNFLRGEYYDISKLENLRIRGVSENFKELRKKLGTQREIAKVLNTFRENVKRWENDEASIPFHVYWKIHQLNGNSYFNLLKELLVKKVLFGEGALQQLTRLPLVASKKDEAVLRYMVPIGKKVLIKSYGLNNRNMDKEKLFEKIYALFGTKISKDKGSYFLYNSLVCSFLRTFYVYERFWSPITEEESKALTNAWNSF